MMQSKIKKTITFFIIFLCIAPALHSQIKCTIDTIEVIQISELHFCSDYDSSYEFVNNYVVCKDEKKDKITLEPLYDILDFNRHFFREYPAIKTSLEKENKAVLDSALKMDFGEFLPGDSLYYCREHSRFCSTCFAKNIYTKNDPTNDWIYIVTKRKMIVFNYQNIWQTCLKNSDAKPIYRKVTNGDPQCTNFTEIDKNVKKFYILFKVLSNQQVTEQDKKVIEKAGYQKAKLDTFKKCQIDEQ